MYPGPGCPLALVASKGLGGLTREHIFLFEQGTVVSSLFKHSILLLICVWGGMGCKHVHVDAHGAQTRALELEPESQAGVMHPA